MRVRTAERGSRASQYLDFIRGLAALFVMLGHARNLLLVDYREIHAPGIGVKTLYFFTGIGHECVVAFFVLSGLFIGAGVVERVSNESWRFDDYLISRGARLYTVLVPALVLTLAWDLAGLQLTGADSIYHGIGPQSVIHDVGQRLTTGTLFGNLLFAQTILVPTFGSNGALWSLSNEFWYYMLFPCLWIAGSRKAGSATRLMCALAFVAMAWFARSLLPLFPLWMLGAGVSLLPRCRVLSRPWLLNAASIASVLCCGLALAAIRFDCFSNQIVSDYCLGVLVSLLIYCVLHYNAPATAGRLWHASDAFAAMSYTLYVAHLPVLMFVAGVVRQGARLMPTPGSVLFYFAVCSLVIVYALVISRGTEAHTNLVRHYLVGLFRAPCRATAPAPRVDLDLEPRTRH